MEADLHVPGPFLSRTVCTLAEAAPPLEVPVHLQDLLERTSEELTEEQRPQLAEMLTESQNVFASSEFDFGVFMVLVHENDTGEAPRQGKDAEDPSFFLLGRRRLTLRRCWKRLLSSSLYQNGLALQC